MRRRAFRALPFPILRSDVRDVIYATWLVPAERMRPILPEGVELVERGGLTPFTVLTYRHGHFGPLMLGPLRSLLPSPLQSNWRLYVSRIGGVPTDEATVLFIRNLFDSALYAAGTRLFSDALPSHLPARFAFDENGGRREILIDGGNGSAPSMRLSTADATDPDCPAGFAGWFGGIEPALRLICLQDAAISALPDDDRRIAHARIRLPVDLARVRWLAVRDYAPGALLRAFAGEAQPWCFRVPDVRFDVLGEHLIDLPPATS
ncbi:MAG: DUF2071 domain-containing protein [Sphingomonas bacterium]